ncbi:type II secretion system protein [Botrimarina hoheduenensis]|uniref:Type II secretion system protein G n=1 Tax=Botrimarina hoheduenensis TaxID=2528000 RepID=A0A5C5W7D3_9BACT|nr:type II secretion system protein [Botrimarina hoheduenensis]TWT46816.1 hypothetical protein Pla111_19180 [Botrimarina hoheduenensis]
MRPTNDHALFQRSPHAAFPPPSSRAFTLVELLVVIAIIGALVALLLPAVNAARAAAKRAAINAQINQLDAAIEDYKNNLGSYPPNAQILVNSTQGVSEFRPLTPPQLDEQKVLDNFRRHLKKAFPKHREPAALINALCGFLPNGTAADTSSTNPATLYGGMTAAEGLVFWMGGFSEDPKYPISGAKGPSYSLQGLSNPLVDPIEGRNWRLDINTQQLGPRYTDGANQGFFYDLDNRFVVYDDPQQPGSQRRINFWTLKANNTLQPFIYFDASRGDATFAKDAPAVPPEVLGSLNAANPDLETLKQLAEVFAIKQLKPVDTGATPEFFFANDGKFQILHAGIDGAWGEFSRFDSGNNATDLVIPDPNGAVPVYPAGPWTLDTADTLTNFSDTTLGDAQP